MNTEENRFVWMLENLVDSTGAVCILQEHFSRPSYTIEAVRNLVESGTLRAFYFDGGILKVRENGTSTKGKTCFFLKSDLQSLETPKRGRRWN